MRRMSVAMSDPFELALVKAELEDRGFEFIQPDSRFQVIETRDGIFTYDDPIPVRVGMIYQDAGVIGRCGRKLLGSLDAWQFG